MESLEIQEVLNNYFIIRTSWLYSEYGANFMKTMLRLGKDRTELSVVGDQIGTPTYAKDLAEVLLKIVLANEKSYGVYHYSNEGIASWYDFALNIFDGSQFKIKVNPIKSQNFPAIATRPLFSVLDKTKIKNLTNVDIPQWSISLRTCLINLQNNQNGI